MVSIHEYGQQAAHLDLIDTLTRYIALTVPEKRIRQDIQLFRSFSQEEDKNGNGTGAFMSSYVAETLENSLEEYKREEAERKVAP